MGIINKILLGLTLFFSFLLLLACGVPHISTKNIPSLSILSLTVPALVLVNIFILFFWTLKRKVILLLPLSVLIFGFFALGSFFNFRFSEAPISADDLSIMSFNVLGFNKYYWIDEEDVDEKIIDFVTHQNPDIVCFQEFDYRHRKRFPQYPYSFINSIFKDEQRVQQAIFSKFPIINKGALDFPETANNAIYADILYEKDTIRIYNLHLQSFRVIPTKEFISNEPSKKLFRRIGSSLVKQQEQAELVNNHRNKSTHRSIICGDFNNTQFSNVYKVIKGDMKDSFIEMGADYGRTYNFRYFPLRIDFILADSSFEVKSHRNFDVQLSDHFPVMASFR